MTDTYKGVADDKRYTGEDVDITFSGMRCIHAAECVNRLAEVFDVDRRPWILPDGASEVDRVVEVISMCPSGALHAHRKDGGQGEVTPATNTIIVKPGSYYQVRGDIVLEGTNVALEAETRAALCRCGASEAKPFCDNSHKELDFDTAEVEAEADGNDLPPGQLRITVHTNGPMELNGPFEIRSEAGNLIHKGSKTWLCRCGDSDTKPFCDGTHKENGFEGP